MCIRRKVISVTPITTGMVASTRLSRYLASICQASLAGDAPRPALTSSLLSVGDENVLHPRARLVGVVRADVEVHDPLVDTPQVVRIEQDRSRQIVGEDVLDLGVERLPLGAVGALKRAIHELVDLRVAVGHPVEPR